MPWKVSDVDSKKKGLNPTQKKKWVKIANGILKDCLADGGSTKSCEAKAIRIANSNFSEATMDLEKMKVPNGAMRFVDSGCHAHIQFAEGDGEDTKPKLKMVAYGGGIIKNHWYWDDLGIDLSGMKFQKKNYPILEDHRESRKIAFSLKPPEINEKNNLIFDPEKVEFTDTEASLEFQKLSKKGFPYEASIYVTPTVIERIDEGSIVEFNDGVKLKGPGTVFRECIFNEASVCVFGWDRQTQSSAFSKDEQQEIHVKVVSVESDQHIDDNDVNTKGKEVKTQMTKEEFAEKYPDLMKTIQEEAVAAAGTEFKKQEEDLSGQITALKKDNDEKDGRILDLEKRDAIRTENELRAKAEFVWNEKLSASSIPDHLGDKVRRHVTYEKFVKDGVFDVEAFSTKIDEEIEDWVKRGVTTSVMGAGFSNRDEQDSETKLVQKETEENVSAANNLLALAGHKTAKAE